MLPGGLLRCFVRRQQGTERNGGTKFFLYMGADHTQPSQCKFLLAALFISRCVQLGSAISAGKLPSRSMHS